jgi:acyl-[acyl-carrier-protein]-phospholipid O-acyltransferase/long-chain-fatty-acid--[acyl-carrier-protein] ligase
MLSTATFLRFCLKRAEVGDFDSVRLLVCGAEKLPVPLAREFSERFGVLPIEGYGCTELSPVSNINLPDLVLANGRKLLRNQPGSVGRMVSGCTCRILDPDTGLPMPDGMPGMIHIAGANVMRGYLGQPGKTAEVVHEGYYRTGDIGYVDERGHIVITGRLSRFAKSGGEMVPLERIEQMLHEELPSTDRVCGVSCVPDQTRGERVVVLFVPEALAEYGIDIKTWLKRLSARGIPPLWIPSERDFLPVPEIPILGSGKLDLQQLAQMARTLAGSNG